MIGDSVNGFEHRDRDGVPMHIEPETDAASVSARGKGRLLAAYGSAHGGAHA